MKSLRLLLIQAIEFQSFIVKYIIEYFHYFKRSVVSTVLYNAKQEEKVNRFKNEVSPDIFELKQTLEKTTKNRK